MRNNRLTHSLSRGFTLIELLVVVGVMAVMLSIAAVGIQNIDKGQATISGIAQAQGLMDEARSLAIGRGTRARLCIHAESNEEERNLRYVVVAYERIERDASGEPTGNTSWTVESRGTFLPAGVYFHPDYSTQAASRVDSLGSFGLGSSDVTFPGDNNSTRRPSYYFFEFNSEGLCTEEGQSDPGAAFVLCRGVTGPGAKVPRVIGNDVEGFVVWRNGRSSSIRDTDFVSPSS